MAEFTICEMLMIIIGAIVIEHSSGQVAQNTEPTCYSKFDYDYKLMQKLSELQTEQKVLNEQLFKQSKLIEELQNELQDSASSQWGDWTSWSQCTVSCTGQDGGRLQTRDRTRSTSPSGTQSESETRPCNAVQFAGCVKDHGSDDNYAVVYDYAEQVAVSTCTALLPGGSNHVYAIRRQCGALYSTCEEVCKTNELTCFNSLHVYKSGALSRNDYGKKGMFMYRYNGCGGGCGPNFCCCKKK